MKAKSTSYLRKVFSHNNAVMSMLQIVLTTVKIRNIFSIKAYETYADVWGQT